MNLTPLLITISAFLAAITVHEFSHALAATLLGDPTPQRAGRLTLNPFSHIDIIGLLMLLLIRIGWAKPVPFDARNFRYPRIYSILVAFAGPLSNFIFALFCLYCVRYLLPLTGPSWEPILSEFFKQSVWLNVMLGVFNLVPIPPLDGSHLLEVLIPRQLKWIYYISLPFSIIILLILLNITAVQELFFNSIVTVTEFLSKLVI